MNKPTGELIEQLVDRAVGGDRQAFSAIVSAMMPQVAALTYRMTGERESALDLAQETFVSAWENLATFRRDAGFSGWLYRIAVNKSLNYLKASRRMQSPENVDQLVAVGNPEKEFLQKELAGRVLTFMASLPDQQRAIFNLRFYHQLSFREIAETLGRAEGTVKTGYREAVRKLREAAEAEGWRS